MVVELLAVRLGQPPSALAAFLGFLHHGLLVLDDRRLALHPADEFVVHGDAVHPVRGVADQHLCAVLERRLVEGLDRVDPDQVDLRIALVLVEGDGRVRRRGLAEAEDVAPAGGRQRHGDSRILNARQLGGGFRLRRVERARLQEAVEAEEHLLDQGVVRGLAVGPGDAPVLAHAVLGPLEGQGGPVLPGDLDFRDLLGREARDHVVVHLLPRRRAGRAGQEVEARKDRGEGGDDRREAPALVHPYFLRRNQARKPSAMPNDGKATTTIHHRRSSAAPDISTGFCCTLRGSITSSS